MSPNGLAKTAAVVATIPDDQQRAKRCWQGSLVLVHEDEEQRDAVEGQRWLLVVRSRTKMELQLRLLRLLAVAS